MNYNRGINNNRPLIDNFKKRKGDTIQTNNSIKEQEHFDYKKELNSMEIELEKKKDEYLDKLSDILIQGYSVEIIEDKMSVSDGEMVSLDNSKYAGKVCYKAELMTSYILRNIKDMSMGELKTSESSSAKMHMPGKNEYGNFVSDSLYKRISIENKLKIGTASIALINKINEKKRVEMERIQEKQRIEEELKKEQREKKLKLIEDYRRMQKRTAITYRNNDQIEAIEDESQQQQQGEQQGEHEESIEDEQNDENHFNTRGGGAGVGESTSEINLN